MSTTAGQAYLVLGTIGLITGNTGGLKPCHRIKCNLHF